MVQCQPLHGRLPDGRHVASLRVLVASRSVRDWIERVCQLQNTVEHRDRVIAEQKKTIASQLAIIERLRATVENCDPAATNPGNSANPPSTTGRVARSARKPTK
jgi:hypothetical protein